MQQKSGRNVARHQQRLGLESDNVGEGLHCRPILIATDRLCPLEQWLRTGGSKQEEKDVLRHRHVSLLHLPHQTGPVREQKDKVTEMH
jgi:hypothetical protein